MGRVGTTRHAATGTRVLEIAKMAETSRSFPPAGYPAVLV